MNTNEAKEITNISSAAPAKPALAVWLKVVFIVDIIVLALTSTMFIRILTGGWQESITRNFGNEPAILQSAYINAVITLLLVVVGIAANILLLKMRRIGVTLGFIALVLVLLAVAVQLWGGSAASNPMAMSIQGPISVLRILYNVIYLLALLKTKKVMSGWPARLGN